VRMIGKNLVLVLLALGPSVRAEVAIPVVGQPTPFYGAAGKKLKVDATATPTDLTLEDSILFTLRVEGLLNGAEVVRPHLLDIEQFARDFQIEDEPATANEPAGTRVFQYRLRPRGLKVKAIPEFVFPYYDPDIPQPADRPELPFRKARTAVIALSIRKATLPPPSIVPLEIPPFAESLAPPDTHFPSWAMWLAFLAPPFLAVGWYIGWRLLNPEGARLARRQRSRAARTALRSLQILARGATVSSGDVVHCVTNYLTLRYNLPGVFRTPRELTQNLREARAGEIIIANSETFLRTADAARFSPNASPATDALVADAERLIRDAEGDA